MDKMTDLLQPYMDRQDEGWLQEQYTRITQHPDVQAFLHQHRDTITATTVKQYMTVLNNFIHEIETYKKTGTSEAVPGYRPVLTWDGHVIDMSYEKTAETLRKEQHAVDNKRVEYISIPKSIRQASFEQLQVTAEKGKAINAVDMAVTAYIDQPLQFHKGIYLWGPFGTGKTYLMGAMVRRLAQAHCDVAFVNVPEFISTLKSHFNDPNYSVQKEIEHIKQAPVLILDDIGAEAMSDWVRDDVLGVILQYRMQEECFTCFTSNLSQQGLEEHLRYTKNKDDELKAKRIMERVYFLASEYQYFGDNQRH